MRYVLALIFLFAPPSWSQTTTGNARTSGSCSAAVTGSGNTINIKTCGMTMQQNDELRGLLRQVLKKQIDPNVLIRTLDNIESGQIRIENGVLRIEKDVQSLTEHYAPNGFKMLQTGPGHLDQSEGEFHAFEQMTDLYKSHDWASLAAVCDAEIKKVPNWFTPYNYLAVAYANLGRSQESAKMFKRYLDLSASDSDYQSSRELALSNLEQVKHEASQH